MGLGVPRDTDTGPVEDGVLRGADSRDFADELVFGRSGLSTIEPGGHRGVPNLADLDACLAECHDLVEVDVGLVVSPRAVKNGTDSQCRGERALAGLLGFGSVGLDFRAGFTVGEELGDFLLTSLDGLERKVPDTLRALADVSLGFWTSGGRIDAVVHDAVAARRGGGQVSGDEAMGGHGSLRWWVVLEVL